MIGIVEEERITTTSGDIDQIEGLARLARDGDDAARVELAEQLLPRLRGFARGTVGPASLWEDAAQDAIIRVLRSLPTYRDGNFLGWALTITRNACLDALRAERRHARRFEARWDVQEPTEQLDTRAAIESAVRSLPEHLQFTLLLREQGFPYREIASILEVPIGTVRSRLHDARLAMRDKLRDLFDDQGEHDVRV